MSNALAVQDRFNGTLQPGHAPPSHAPAFTLAEMERMATSLAQSRLFPGIQTSQAALTLMLLCHAEGLHPIQAMKRYHIIEGRPSMRADAMQAEFQRKGGIVRWIVSDSDACEAQFIHPIHAPEPGFTVSATLKEFKDSRVAMSWDKDKKEWKVKDVWRKFPRQMLRARVISEGVRAVLPEVVVGIYTPEEVADFDDPKAPRAIEVRAEEVPAPTKVEPKTWPELVGLVMSAWARKRPCDAKVGTGRRNRLVNHLATWAVESGLIESASILSPNAKGELKRDDDKAEREVVALFGRERARVIEEARAYLKEKLAEPEPEFDADAGVATPVYSEATADDFDDDLGPDDAIEVEASEVREREPGED